LCHHTPTRRQHVRQAREALTTLQVPSAATRSGAAYADEGLKFATANQHVYQRYSSHASSTESQGQTADAANIVPNAGRAWRSDTAIEYAIWPPTMRLAGRAQYSSSIASSGMNAARGILVLGSGSAGCALTSQLPHDQHIRVLLRTTRSASSSRDKRTGPETNTCSQHCRLGLTHRSPTWAQRRGVGRARRPAASTRWHFCRHTHRVTTAGQREDWPNGATTRMSRLAT
jgi:hypothetical protein